MANIGSAENIEALYTLLHDTADIYEYLLTIETQKYDAALKNDIVSLDDVVAKEQAYYLKIRGMENTKKTLIDSMGLEGKTLKEIIDDTEGSDKEKLRNEYDRLYEILTEVKAVNQKCKNVIGVRLRKIDAAMSMLGEKDNTYGPNDNKKNYHKNLMISKTI